MFTTLLAIVPFFLTALITRYIYKSWVAPGAFFSLFWCLAVTAAILGANEYVSIPALIYIFFAVVSHLLGSLLSMQYVRNFKHRKNMKFICSKQQLTFLKLFTLFSILLAVASLSVAMLEVGFTVRQLLSFEQLVSVANWFSVGRYQESYNPSFLSQVLRIFVYLAPLLGGSLQVLEQKQATKLVSLATLIPALIITIVQTQRGVTIIAFVLFFSTYTSTQLALGRTRLISFSRILSIAGLAVIFFLFFTTVALFRAGISDFGLLVSLFPKMYSIVFGYLTGFSHWFEELIAERSSYQGLGVYTFAGISDMLGIKQRETGLFTEFVILQGNYLSNIYTVFRPLIQDFGIVGSYFFLIASGYVASLAYSKVCFSNIHSTSLLSAFYAFTLISYNTSIWIWNTVIIAFCFYHIIYYLIFKWTIKNRKRKIHYLNRSPLRSANETF